MGTPTKITKFSSRFFLRSGLKVGGLRPAAKLEIDILADKNWRISANIWCQNKNEICTHIYSSRSVHFRGVLNHLNTFLDPPNIKSEIWSTFVNFRFGNFQKWSQRGYQKSSNHKNTPESSVSERDLTPVKMSSKNIEKQKS